MIRSAIILKVKEYTIILQKMYILNEKQLVYNTLISANLQNNHCNSILNSNFFNRHYKTNLQLSRADSIDHFLDILSEIKRVQIRYQLVSALFGKRAEFLDKHTVLLHRAV